MKKKIKKILKKLKKIAYKNIEKLNRYKVDTLPNLDKLKSNKTALNYSNGVFFSTKKMCILLKKYNFVFVS